MYGLNFKFEFTLVKIPVKFIYSEKAKKIFKMSTLLLPYVVPIKSKVEISQNFVAFSEYMNFIVVANKTILLEKTTLPFLGFWTANVFSFGFSYD